MIWTITFYNDKVEVEILALPPGILASFLRITELIETFGPDLGRPHIAPLGQGLFEIHAKGRVGIARSFFCIPLNKNGRTLKPSENNSCAPYTTSSKLNHFFKMSYITYMESTVSHK